MQTQGAAIAVEVFLGGMSAAALNRYLPGQQARLAGRGLVAAAAVYPLARRRSGLCARAEVAREGFALAAAFGVAARARRMPDADARALVAVGWAAHAAFDLLHEHGPGSRLPGWYRPLCVGFDAAVALGLAARSLPDPPLVASSGWP